MTRLPAAALRRRMLVLEPGVLVLGLLRELSTVTRALLKAKMHVDRQLVDRT